MRGISLKTSAIALILFSFSTNNFSQTPPLGSASNFAVFTAVGAFNNDGLTTIVGDIGTNVGAFAGFPPGIVAGTIHVTDPVSVQAATDVEFAYSSFAPISCDLVIGTTLGNNQVLSPAVYCLGAASSLNGDLILDGQCDPNALFIIKIDGALSTTSFSNVILTNSASACNIYWQINGAVALGEFSTFKGTIVANGAISFLEGASLEGRALSRSGAVNMHNNTVDLNSQPMASILLVNGPIEFCEGGSVMISGNCGGMWNTGETTPTITVTTSGDYYVTNSNDCGNAVSIHVIITVSPAPVCTISGASTICAGQSTQLCVSAGAASYLWSTGATTNCITVSTAATYAVTVTGANGCSSICSQEVSVSPAPVCAISGASTICAGQSTQLCVPPGAASYLWSTGATTNCITVSTAATYAVTVTGANGCSSICSQEVSVSPAPVCLITGADIPCLGQSSELCVPAGADGYMWSTGATTNCITVFVAGTYSVTVTNAGNCTNICGITISVNQDNIPPAIICPMDLTLECDLSTQPPNTGTATATDACDLAPVLDFTDLINPENCPQSYSIARVWTATDGAGNNSVCVQTITVADNTPPVIICPANLSLNCNSSTLPSDTGTATATDNCSFAPQVNSNDVTTPGNCPQAFTITRTWTAIDACENSSNCTQTILVADATPPTITCPANVTVQCASLVPIANTALVTATDNCGGTTTISHLGDAITNQVCANNYTLTRTYQAADACGNTANCAQVVTVFDATIPTITCPANVSVQCAGLVPIANTALVTATDNCGGATTISHLGDAITNQVCANHYTLTRTYQSADACGNTADCAQVITVFDATIPTLTCPANVSVQCAGLVPIVNTALVTATDNCGSATTISHLGDAITNQVCANNYTLTRTYQAADACGNTADCAQVITVFDATIPTISCPANVSVQCAGLVPPVDIPLVGAADNCGSSVIVTFVADAVSSQTCTNQYVLTRTYRATDVCGNVAECAQVITVFDNTPPSISFVNPLLVPGGTLPIQCYGQDPSWSLPVFNAGSITATDICGGDVAVTFDEILVQEGSCKVDGFINLYRLTWTATDICGNSSTAFVFLALIDTIAPTISGIPADITVHCNDIPAVPTNVVGMDECLCACDITFEESIPLSGCLDGQVIVRSWSAKDRCGNITTQSQKITLIDDQGPDWLILQPEIAGITQDTIINYPCNDGFPAYLDLLSEQFALGSNSCGASFVMSFQVDTIISANCDLSGFRQQRTYHWTGVDECGNISSLTITARLVDKETPTIIGVPIDAVCIGNPILNLVSSSDNCGTSTLQFEDTFVQNPCGTAKAIQRIFTAKDECGNMARDTALLIPNDQTQPLISFINPVLAGMEFGEILTTECASQSGTYTNFGVGDIEVQDACLEGLQVAFTETLISSGDCTTDGNLATVLLMWTATDICGNYNELSITAHIVDETSPVFVNFLPEITIGCNADLPELQIIDNCGSVSTSIWDTIIYGPCILNYDMQRIITATDQCGNSSTAIQTIHVGNGSGPAMSEVEEMVCDDVSIPVVTAYDGCAEAFIGVTMQADTLDLPCSGLMIKRTWTAVDNCGNSANRQQIILLNDTIPPVISTPVHSIIPYYTNSANGHVFSSQLDQIKLLNALDSSSVFVADDCDQLITPVFNMEITHANNCLEDGYMEHREYSWVFTDACGNSSAMAFSVDIIDDIPPVFVVMPPDVTIVCAPLPPAPVVFTDDNPLSVSIAYSESIEPGIGIGVFNVTRTWTATDACGNVTVYVQHIKWIPDTFLECEIELPAVVTCNTHGVMISSTYTGGNGPVSYVWEIVGENCFIQAGQGTPTIKIYMGWTDAELILTITDSAGCVSTCTATVSCLFSLDLFNGSPLTDTPDDSSTPFRSILQSTDEDLKELNVWPNPSSGTINLSFVSMEENEVELIISNFLGESVFRNKTIAQKGLNTLKIDMSQMREGGYLIQLKTAKVVHTKTAVIMHNN